MFYATFWRQSFVASFVVALLAGVHLFWMPIASGQTPASGTLTVGATVIKSCNINRSLPAEGTPANRQNHPIQCWQPNGQQQDTTKPEVRLLPEGGQHTRVWVVY